MTRTVDLEEHRRAYLEALLARDPRPLVVVGGQLWRGPARAEADGLGADLVVGDPRELVGLLRERFPPLPPEAEERAL